jgi:hypothetical protein
MKEVEDKAEEVKAAFAELSKAKGAVQKKQVSFPLPLILFTFYSPLIVLFVVECQLLLWTHYNYRIG